MFKLSKTVSPWFALI